ncbi:MAG TPA: TraB/GumN family protein [Kofleriaceae bacterium]|nr:TraB/GumN family protein [Kofleriaceae bacterium]
MAELPASVTRLEDGSTTFYVLGTAHVSRRSVEEVREVIAQLQPDVVCVELCKARLDALTKDSAFRDLDVFKVVREGKTLYLLAHLALGSYQRKLGKSLGVRPGAELIAAVEAAREAQIPLELIDRDINITLRRTWANLGWWKRFSLLWSLLASWGGGKGEAVTEQTVEDLKEPKALSEMLTELGRAVPEVKGPLVDERDRYLVSKMRDAGAGKTTVLAVVGAAHVPGMVANLHAEIDRAALEQPPPRSLVWRIAKWAVPVAFVTLLGVLWWRTGTASFARAMLAWTIPTSLGASGMTLLFGGSPLSALAALIAAPIARIYPLVRTGIVVGIVEAWRRKPSVADCERLPEDTQSARGFWRNPVTRILIIATVAGLGALAGFAVGVGMIASRV